MFLLLLQFLDSFNQMIHIHVYIIIYSLFLFLEEKSLHADDGLLIVWRTISPYGLHLWVMDVDGRVMRILFTTECCPTRFDNEMLSEGMAHSINMLFIRRKVNNFRGLFHPNAAEKCVETLQLNRC